jgi:uncharacterized protein (DUF1501 family)
MVQNVSSRDSIHTLDYDTRIVKIYPENMVYTVCFGGFDTHAQLTQNADL